MFERWRIIRITIPVTCSGGTADRISLFQWFNQSTRRFKSDRSNEIARDNWDAGAGVKQSGQLIAMLTIV